MIIMTSTLAKAINECRYIKPEELTRDNFKVIENNDQNSSEKNSNKKEGK